MDNEARPAEITPSNCLDFSSFYRHFHRCIPARFFNKSPEEGLVDSPEIPERQEKLDQSNDLINEVSSLDIIIAFSGGIDSVVLLNLLAKTIHQLEAAMSFPITLRAIYINHHLQAESNHWQNFCQKQTKRHDVAFKAIDVTIANKKSNIEAQAREARYHAFQQEMSDNSLLITAHHRDDQLETFFLNLMRGSGLDGLTAMQAISKLNVGGLNIGEVMRPLLPFSKGEIMRHALTENLSWIEDNSNNDNRYDRNYLRHELLPILKARWPSSEDNISRSISHLQDVRVVTEEYLNNQISHLLLPKNDISSCLDNAFNVLNLNKIIILKNSDLRLVFRQWLKNQKSKLSLTLPYSHIEIMIEFVANYRKYKENLKKSYIDKDHSDDKSNHLPQIKLFIKEIAIVNHSNELYVLPKYFCDIDKNSNTVDSDFNNKVSFVSCNSSESGLDISYKFLIKNSKFYGFSMNFEKNLQWRHRQGGEVFVARDGTKKTLKKVWQEISIPYWEKSQLPLLYYRDQIVWVPGISINQKRADFINHRLGFEFWQLATGYIPIILLNESI